MTYALLWVVAHVAMVMSLTPELQYTQKDLPIPQDGVCRCAMLGCSMSVGYDGSVGVLQGIHNYLISYVSYDPTLYPCSFVFFVRTHVVDGQVLPRSVMIIMHPGEASTTHITEEGVWNNRAVPNWITPLGVNDPVDASLAIAAVKTGENSYTITSTNSSCLVSFHVKLAGADSEFVVYSDKSTYGNYLLGMCGNCNNIDDDYSLVPDDSTIDPVFLLQGNWTRDQMTFVPVRT